MLHDVVEDTSETLVSLATTGISPRACDLVDLLTHAEGMTRADYYARIATDRDALVIKCADRCANLQDALEEVLLSRDVPRWRRYAVDTRTNLLPYYRRTWRLYNALEWRVCALDAALHAAERGDNVPDDAAELLRAN
jgi:(p)ppGpp synthase/HD superfamily hydrolase